MIEFPPPSPWGRDIKGFGDKDENQRAEKEKNKFGGEYNFRQHQIINTD